MPDRRFVHVTIHGRVQGVGFRYFIEKNAIERALDGWVRNREDGAVEAVVAGPPAALQEMVRWAQQGPPRASVETVEATPADDPGRTGFEVR